MNLPVAVPTRPNVRVCTSHVLQMPESSTEVSRIKSLKSMFEVKNVKEVFRKCVPKLPMPVKVVGEGGYGRVFELKGGDLIAKFQVFPWKKIDNQTGEIFLNQLFAKNKISPRVVDAVLFYTSDQNMGASLIALEKHASLSTVLKATSGRGRARIMRMILPQAKRHLDRMLTLGFACVDLKPGNALFNLSQERLYMIDFSPNLCPQTPVLLDRFARSKGPNSIVSTLSDSLRRQIINTQLLFLHVTTKRHGQSMLARADVARIIDTPSLIQFAYSILIKKTIPPGLVNLTRDSTVNAELLDFLNKFAGGASLNFIHYSGLSRDTTFEEFVEFLERV